METHTVPGPQLKELFKEDERKQINFVGGKDSKKIFCNLFDPNFDEFVCAP